MPLFFTALSVLGIFIGGFMVTRGIGGEGLGAALTLFIGGFVVIKEIMDIIFAK